MVLLNQKFIWGFYSTVLQFKVVCFKFSIICYQLTLYIPSVTRNVLFPFKPFGFATFTQTGERLMKHLFMFIYSSALHFCGIYESYLISLVQRVFYIGD